MAEQRRIERLGPSDLTELASDVGPVPMNVGAVLFLAGDRAAGDGTVNAATIEATFTKRISGIRRLRQCLVDPPPGLGRPYWADDELYDAGAHFARVRCPDQGDRDAALAIAVDAVTEPLPRSRPLWRAIIITDLVGDCGAVGLVMVLHHVLADGIGGLAILGHLVDGMAAAGSVDEIPSASPPPRPMELLADCAVERLRMLRGFPAAVAGVRGGWSELGHSIGRRAPRCSLNVATGPRRRVTTLETDLRTLREAGRSCGGTVNDVLLAAVTGALANLLHRWGEFPLELVVSVPVSARRSTTSGHLGNQVGVMPVRVPLAGGPAERVTAISRITRDQKRRTRGTSAALIGPLFRFLAAVKLFRWFVDRQRLVNSFLSNLPGPPSPLAIAGVPIVSMVPITVTAGNVGVAFAALSYAGTLTVTIIADPGVVPEIDDLAAALHEQLQVFDEGNESAR
ncbi:wax ester/triacylglycerol synthase domain-containing protein [Rhodococcus sp. NPDC019627]|uniref:wax ester/triacylglycerol synthase domain-containing protein n=1 Tax=unclassified Rhodococcus (in: high G+C Gram-positive bacteria) TaxID=192944 RepID=UPI0034043A94